MMELTKEQAAIINSTGNIKINAVAGSGKTTTLIEYARARPGESKIIYLAFNKSVKLEAIQKFAIKGLSNVKVETAHSLAYKHIVFRHDYKVRNQGYKTNEIAECLDLKGNGEKHTEYVIANHINKFITYFCNSDKQRVQDLNYLDVVSDKKARIFVTTFYSYIETQTRILLAKMDKGEIDITHDFYLKKFQLSDPLLNYDYILFDEAQDASQAMLDVVLKQKATKVIVGDTHQQIYSWRYAVNSLEKAEFQTFNLSTSFRFSQDIANLAMEVLNWKKHLEKQNSILIKGEGTSKKYKSKAILARTNLGLLLKAIEYVTEQKKIKHIYFEGNINSYTYADDGTSLYDVLNLYNGKRNLIRDKLIATMNDLDELGDYITKSEDVQLGMMVEIVKEYGNDIPGIIKSIKAKHIENDEKEKAEMIFSTVHRSKGMEYDSVQLVNDFITEEKLEKLKADNRREEISISKLNEEINLLYVAITRTRNSIHIPESLMPGDFPVSSHIHIIREFREKERPEDGERRIEGRGSRIESRGSRIGKWEVGNSATERQAKGNIKVNEKSYSVENIREKHKAAYLPWTSKLDDELTVMYCEGVNVRDMGKHFGRTRGAIKARIDKLGLEEMYG